MAFQPKTQALDFGAKAPDFDLPGVDGKRYRLSDIKSAAVVVVFACNHCPYVQAYEDRFVDLMKTYHEKGVRFFVINSNDEKNYPEDSFEKMKERAKLKQFPYPYLRDADQKVAESFGAGCTPEVFLFDSHLKLQYHGRIDDNWEKPTQVKQHYLRDALEALLQNKKVERQETHPIGCSIKWSA